MLATTKRCKHGHPWTDTNTRWQKAKNGKPYRVCRRCHAIQQSRAYLPVPPRISQPRRVYPRYGNRDYPL
jgi:hypothetical protein